jgi:hypothetical protein
MEIVAVKNSGDDKEVLWPKLGMFPPHPHMIGFSAPPGSGKTNVIINLLTNPLAFKKFFHIVYAIIPTFYNDPKWKALNIPEDQVMTQFDSAAFVSLLEDHNKAEGNGQNHRLLFIFDDAIANKELFNNNKDSILNKLAFNRRHWNASVWIVTQSYKMVPRNIRTNMSSWVFFATGNSSEKDRIFEEMQGLLPDDAMEWIWDDATAEPYSFLFVNCMHPERRARYWKRFEHRYSVEDALPPKYNAQPLQDPPGTTLKPFAKGIPLFQDSNQYDMKINSNNNNNKSINKNNKRKKSGVMNDNSHSHSHRNDKTSANIM